MSLHVAARSGDLERVKCLVETKGFDPHAKGDFGCTPLHEAARAGHEAVLYYFIDEKQCDPNCRDYAGETPLHNVCMRGHQAIVEALVDKKQCDPNCRDKDGWTPLHHACWKGHQAIVEHLIDKRKCDPNSRDHDGKTILHHASWWGHQAIVQYLTDKKQCDPKCTDNDGWTPLHCACWYSHETIVDYFINNEHCDPNCRDNAGETPLHHACRLNRYDIVCCLLSKSNPNIANNDGCAPLSLTSDPAIIRELIKFGANAEVIYKRYLPGSYSRQPASSVMKTFLFGDPEAGKTTLTEAIKSESCGIISNLSGRFKKVLKTNERTAGIVPHHFESRHFGSVSLYDLAGQREFYASHDALLQSSVPGEAAVYLIVANLSKTDEEFQETLLYWLSYIGNHRKSSKQHVIIVGSHADLVHSKKERSQKEDIVISLRKVKAFNSLHFAAFVVVDCRYAQSDSMTKLRQCLRQSYEVLRSAVKLQMRTHCFLVYILEKNSNTPAITLGSVVTGMEREENKDLVSYFPHDICHLVDMCEELTARGNILFFNNSDSPMESTIVLDQATLFSRVTGTVFAPESFKQHAALASSTGVVPFTKLASKFPDLDSNMIAHFMRHLEFCREVSDPEVLQLLQASIVGTGEKERYLFFPGLVSIQAPGRLWEQGSRSGCHSGWHLQCIQPEHFFTPRFLQVLILRLAFSFVLAPHPVAFKSDGPGLPRVSSNEVPAIHRRCSVWKNGIYWVNGYGAEALVEVSTDGKEITISITGEKGYVAAAAELRSGVIRKVLQTKEDFCSGISCQESLLHLGSLISYPLSCKSASGVPITAVAEAIIRAEPFVIYDCSKMHLEKLLGFEPYTNLGEALLKELFDETSQHYDEPLKDEFIYRIARKAYSSMDLFVEALALKYPDMLENLTKQGRDGAIHRLATAIQLWRGDYHTINHLRERLDQFSVFAGRNPLSINM